MLALSGFIGSWDLVFRIWGLMLKALVKSPCTFTSKLGLCLRYGTRYYARGGHTPPAGFSVGVIVFVGIYGSAKREPST